MVEDITEQMQVEISLRSAHEELAATVQDLKKEIAERRKVEQALRESEARYRAIFEDSPVSIWEEDFSAVKTEIDHLRAQGIHDFRIYFLEYPEEVSHLISQVKILDINKATLEIQGVRTKEDFLKDVRSLASPNIHVQKMYIEELVAVADGKTNFELEGRVMTLRGEAFITLRWSVPRGYQDTWSKVYVSIMDITERKRAERTQQALYRISEAANMAQDLQSFFSLVHRFVSELTRMENFYIALYDEATDTITMPYFIDEFDGTLHDYHVKSAKGLTSYLIRVGKPLIINRKSYNDLIKEKRIEACGKPPVEWLGIPLKTIDEKIIGALVVQTYDKNITFSEEDYKLLSFVSTQVAMAIKRKQAVDELRTAHNELENRVQERTAELLETNQRLKHEIAERECVEVELRQAKEAAEAATSAKTTFLANMSHELRTPLNVIIGYSELLQEEAEDMELEKFIPDLKKIVIAAKHLLQLINDVLDISKIEAGKIQLEVQEFSIKELIQNVEVVSEPLAKRKANVFEIDCPIDIGTMSADMTRVRQCLFNLISNAAKFTENGQIRLIVRRVPGDEAKEFDHIGDLELPSLIENHDWIIFQVTDTGIGMTSEQMDKMFLPFSQADASTTRKYGGTGLGLSITKQICEVMGGSISVDSIANVGSIFTLWFPARIG
jgi:signal transduction histidine kinase/PAS domain-containing protein